MLVPSCRLGKRVQHALLRRLRTSTQYGQHIIRRAASSKSAPLPQRTASTQIVKERVSPSEQRKSFAAQQLYRQGVRNIYTAPSHVAIYSITWFIAITLIGNAGRLAYERYDKLREGHGRSRVTVMFIEGGNRLVMAAYVVIGAYALSRYRNVIKSIRLLSNGYLRVSVRRFVPFLKPRVLEIPPYDLRLPRAWMVKSEPVPLPPTRGIIEGISRAFYVPFIKAKNFFTMHGFLAVTLEDGKQNALLDANGAFGRSMADLDAITVEDF
jgi:hypothetical protein